MDGAGNADVVTAALAQPGFDVLAFEASGQRYALRTSAVRELLRAVSVVPLPTAPSIVEGVVNVRGSVVPVLDIRARFGLSPKPLEHTDHFLLAWAGRRLVALRTDRALDLLHLDTQQVEDAKRIVPGVQYVAGVAKLPDGMLLIHDLETFLSDAEAAGLDAAVSSLSEGEEQG